MRLSKKEVFDLIMQDPRQRGTLACHIPNLFSEEELPPWSEFINHLSDSVQRFENEGRTSGLNKELETMYGATVTKGRYYSMSAITDVDIDELGRFKGLFPIEEMLQEFYYPSTKYISDAFVSFITNDEYATPHQDIYTNNLFVGCQGKVQWNIYEKEGDRTPVETYVLAPGDIIYVRGEVFHEVEVLEPRASVVFRINVGLNPEYS